MSALAPDPEAAIAFLELLRSGGPWVLTAITPDGPTTTTETFYKAEAAARWIERENASRNIYVMCAEATGALRTKAKKEHVARSRHLWADVDGDEDLRGRLNGHVPPPTMIVASGGGLNVWWGLASPIEDVAEIEARNRWLSENLGADHCWNADRILRVPGTINWPNAKKRRAGRGPVLARCVEFHPDRIYDLADFGRAEADAAKERAKADLGGEEVRPVTLADLSAEIREKLPAWARRLILDGPAADEYHGDRSKAVLAVTCALIRAGASDAHIAGILLNPELPIHDHVRDQKGHGPRAYVARQIERARERVKDDEPDAAKSARSATDPACEPMPEPLDIIGAPELVGWPTLTADCLPEPLYRYVMAEADRLNVDPCPLAGQVLAACAASISDALSIKPKQHDPWTQQARVWTCVVKDVGSRGTEMIRSAFWPVKERDAELFKAWRSEHAEWKAKQLEAAQARGGKRAGPGEKASEPEPRCQRLVTNDATIEAMSEILKDGDETGKLTLLCDELVAFLGGFGRYTDRGAAQRALMLEAYDGGPQRVDRIKRGHVYVPNWSVIVAGNIQPRRLAGMARDLTDDGLFQRFLTLHTKPTTLGLEDDRPIAPSIGRDYRDLHQALATLRPARGADQQPVPCYVGSEGHQIRRAFMRLVERLQADPTLPVIIRETAPKWSGLLARLTLIFHLVTIAEQQNRGAPPTDRDLCRIGGPTVERAAAFLRRVALPNLFRLGFETLPEEGAPAAHARWLAGHILAHSLADITAREIGRAYRPLRGQPGQIAWAMDILADAGWVTPGETRHDGQRWDVNPAVHTKFAAAAAQERERRARVMAALNSRIVDL